MADDVEHKSDGLQLATCNLPPTTCNLQLATPAKTTKSISLVIHKTPIDLDTYIRVHGIAAELVYPTDETPTVTLAARAVGCADDQIVKSVLFLIKRGDQVDTALIMSNGVTQIDFRKLAGVFGVGRKRISLAPAEVVLDRTGYPAGGVPPFGFEEPIATFIDRHVFEQRTVYAGGGNDKTLLLTTPAELVRVTGAQIIDAREENG